MNRLRFAGIPIVVGLLMALAAATPSKPIMSHDPNAKRPFGLTFDKGAEWICWAFASHNQTLIQGGETVQYIPRKCYEIPPTLTSMRENWEDIICTDVTPTGLVPCKSVDTWDVTATAQYPNPPDENGVVTFISVDSNTITVKH